MKWALGRIIEAIYRFKLSFCMVFLLFFFSIDVATMIEIPPDFGDGVIKILIFGLCWFTAQALWIETVDRHKWRYRVTGACIFTVFAALVLNNVIDTDSIAIGFLMGGGFLSIFITPFIRCKDEGAFWFFTYRFAIRLVYIVFIAALVYDAVGYAFGMNAASLFTKWLFVPVLALCMVPGTRLQPDVEYPKGIATLIKYILVPLWLLGIAVPCLHIFLIAGSHDRPVPIGLPVHERFLYHDMTEAMWLSGVMYFLLYPLYGSFYIRHWAKIMIAPVVIWSGFLMEQVFHHGMTEEIYVTAVLLCWLVINIAVQLLMSAHALRFMGISLVFLLFANALTVDCMLYYNDISCLESVLDHNNMLEKGKIRPAVKEVSEHDREVVTQSLHHLMHSTRKEWINGLLPAHFRVTEDNIFTLMAIQPAPVIKDQ